MSKKEQILKEAVKIFAKKGYENTSLEEIAKEVGITKPAIYYHFKNKKELYNQIFIESFKNLKFENDLKDYIYKMGDFFIAHPNIAKLFSKELACEMEHLDTQTIKIVSKTLKILSEILKDKNVNPFFIQTLIVASFTTYTNTLELRKKISKVWQSDILPEFNIKDEIYKMIILYIKD